MPLNNFQYDALLGGRTKCHCRFYMCISLLPLEALHLRFSELRPATQEDQGSMCLLKLHELHHCSTNLAQQAHCNTSHILAINTRGFASFRETKHPLPHCHALLLNQCIAVKCLLRLLQFSLDLLHGEKPMLKQFCE